MRLRALPLLLVLVIVGAPACSRDEKADDAFRLELDGRATVQSDGDSRTIGAGRHTLAVGDTVRMLEGTGVLELPGDRSMLVRAGGEHATEVDLAVTPDVVDGDAVVIAGEEGARFRAGNVDVQLAEGAARVQHGLSVTVAVYRGSATVQSAGRDLAGGLAALRQVSVAGTGQLPRTPVALLYDDQYADPWDRRFLGDAIDLGQELDVKARGFTGQIGPRVTVDGSLLRRVLPPLAGESDFGDDLVRGDRSPGESLIGAAIAVEGAAGGFRQRWNDVFSFRAEGARWGLVALDQRVKRDALNARLDDAFGRSPLLFAAAPRATTTRPRAGSTTTTTGRGGGASTTTTTAPQTPPTTIGPITVPPTTIPPLPGQDGDGSPPPPPGPVDVITNLVDDLLGQP
jgi:hypothetical protein